MTGAWRSCFSLICAILMCSVVLGKRGGTRLGIDLSPCVLLTLIDSLMHHFQHCLVEDSPAVLFSHFVERNAAKWPATAAVVFSADGPWRTRRKHSRHLYHSVLNTRHDSVLHRVPSCRSETNLNGAKVRPKIKSINKSASYLSQTGRTV